MREFIVVVLFTVGGMFTLAYVMYDDVETKIEYCDGQNGVMVRGAKGHMICIDKKAVIEGL